MKARCSRLILLAIFTVGLLLPVALAAKVKCSGCGRTITGRYIRVNGKPFCSRSCFEKTLPKCVVCGKPAVRMYKKDGKVYCSEQCLLANSPKCAVCGKRAIRGYRKDGKFYCSKECLAKSFPVCAVCGQHARQGVFIGPDKATAKFFCQQCANLPKCYCCGLPDRCVSLKDGRKICRECHKTAVYDQAEAEKLYHEVRRRMQRELGLHTNNKIRFRLVDQTELKKKSPKYAAGIEFGLYQYKSMYRETTTVNAFGKVKKRNSRKVGESFRIFALYGIPKAKLIEVIGHELGHDWMQEYFPDITSLKLKEGWAEYVSTEVNRIYGQPEMNLRIRKNPDKIYGDGYRQLAGIAETGGAKAVIRYLKIRNKSNR